MDTLKFWECCQVRKRRWFGKVTFLDGQIPKAVKPNSLITELSQLIFVQNQLFKLRQFTKGHDLAEFVELDFLQVKESSPRDIV